MKKLYLIANLKMNFEKTQIIKYLKQLKASTKNVKNYVGVCVPSVHLNLTQKVLSKSNVFYGVQNVHYKTSGAYTGEVSCEMVKSYGSTLIIVGHSERRHLFNENDENINKKMHAIINSSLTPILCVGETLSDRQAGVTNKVIKQQLKLGLKNVCDIDNFDVEKLFIAYEPVWAIGTGVSASPKDIQGVIKFIKKTTSEILNCEVEKVKVLYGGSLTEKNASDILHLPSVDGGLIGGASLKVESFEKIYSILVE